MPLRKLKQELLKETHDTKLAGHSGEERTRCSHGLFNGLR